MALWDGVKRLFGQSRFFDSTIKMIANGVIYDEASLEFYRKSAIGNGDVFTVINKIVQPASNLPIKQVDKDSLKDKPGKALKLLNNPNPLMNRTEFLTGALTFHCIFGEGFIVGNSIEGGLNSKQPLRLDLLPPHCMIEQIGTVQEPIKGWNLRWSMGGKTDYTFEEVFHWKDFNPNYDETGNWLRGQSRLKPILKSIAGSDAGYDSLISAFQNMGAYGVLTILGVKQADGSYTDRVTTKQQLSQLKTNIQKSYYGSKKRGQVVATNKSTEWTPFGIKPVDMEILSATDKFAGKIYDAYDVPFILSSAGQGGNKYDTYPQAVLELWINAVTPRVNNFLDKFSSWLMPQFPGEENTKFIADYSNVPCLQEAMRLKIKWMKESGIYSIDEMRIAAMVDAWNIPNSDVPLVALGLQRLDEIGMTPTIDQTANALKHYKDYRLKGGEGSGNYGHEGRPGEVGGSGAGGGNSTNSGNSGGGGRVIEPHLLSTDYDLSKDNVNDATYDIQKGLGFKMGKDYRTVENTTIRVKDHEPEWAYFRDDIDNMGVNKVVNVTVGDYNSNSYHGMRKTTIEEMRTEYPHVKFIDIKVNDGDGINNTIKQISEKINN